MKKYRMVITALVVFALMLSGVSAAFAAKPTPADIEAKKFEKVTGSSSLVKNLASLAGTSTATINKMAAGTSLSAVATSLGIDPQKVIDKTQAGLKARLQKMVKKHVAKQALVNKLMAKSTARLTKLMNHVRDAAPVVIPPVASTPTSPTPAPSVPVTVPAS